MKKYCVLLLAVFLTLLGRPVSAEDFVRPDEASLVFVETRVDENSELGHEASELDEIAGNEVISEGEDQKVQLSDGLESDRYLSDAQELETVVVETFPSYEELESQFYQAFETDETFKTYVETNTNPETLVGLYLEWQAGLEDTDDHLENDNSVDKESKRALDTVQELNAESYARLEDHVLELFDTEPVFRAFFYFAFLTDWTLQDYHQWLEDNNQEDSEVFEHLTDDEFSQKELEEVLAHKPQTKQELEAYFYAKLIADQKLGDYFYASLDKDALIKQFFQATEESEQLDLEPTELRKLQSYFYQTLQRDSYFRAYFYQQGVSEQPLEQIGTGTSFYRPVANRPHLDVGPSAPDIPRKPVPPRRSSYKPNYSGGGGGYNPSYQPPVYNYVPPKKTPPSPVPQKNSKPQTNSKDKRAILSTTKQVKGGVSYSTSSVGFGSKSSSNLGKNSWINELGASAKPTVTHRTVAVGFGSKVSKSSPPVIKNNITKSTVTASFGSTESTKSYQNSFSRELSSNQKAAINRLSLAELTKKYSYLNNVSPYQGYSAENAKERDYVIARYQKLQKEAVPKPPSLKDNPLYKHYDTIILTGRIPGSNRKATDIEIAQAKANKAGIIVEPFVQSVGGVIYAKTFEGLTTPKKQTESIVPKLTGKSFGPEKSSGELPTLTPKPAGISENKIDFYVEPNGTMYRSGHNSEPGKIIIQTNLGNDIDITAKSIHSTVVRQAPSKGVPNSSVDILDLDGNILTRRFYDSNGRVYKDIDMTNHGNPKNHPEFPHLHMWKYDEHGNIIGR